jgi:tetratricopeptide (TPR) repeat protein
VWLAVVVCVTAGAGSVALASAATVRATLDRERMRVGEQATLGIEVGDTREGEPPNLGPIDGFSVRYLGPSTQVSIIQGRVSQSVTYRYALVASRPGRFTLGPFAVSVGGKDYQTNRLALQVVAAGQARGRRGVPKRDPGGLDLALVLETPKREVFLHERLPVTLTLYIGTAPVDDVQYPRIEGDVFSVEPFGKPVQHRVKRDGRTYRTVRFATSIIPLRAGSLSIGPAAQQMSLLSRRRHRDPFFDRFFGANIFSERQPYELHSNAETLTVRPLPEEGRPPDFSGAVGKFDLEVSAQPTELRANDPITLTVRIRGVGNLSGISPPAVGGSGFKTYPAQTVKAEERLGTRVFEQVLLPTSDAVGEIPEIRFTYFDPEAAAYRTASRGPIPLVVRPPERIDIAPGPGQAAERPVAGARPEDFGQDIVYVKDTPGRMRRGAPFYRTPAFLVVQGLPLAVYLLALSIIRRRERLRGDPRYARFAGAAREARRAIARARRAADAYTPAFYDDLARAVREYVGAKLDLPLGAVDVEQVAKRLGKADAPVVRSVDQFFTLIEQVRYAPAADGSGDHRAALELAEAIVRGLERQRGLADRFEGGRRFGALVLAVGLGVAGSVLADDQTAERDPVTSFFEANALYKAGRYQEAAVRYQGLVTAGFESGALHYNLGNAFFRAGELGRAVLSYERARRLLPRDPDVRANLRFAHRQTGANAAAAPASPPLWLRLTVPLAFRATAGELALATSVAYAAAMLLLTLRLFLPAWRQALGRAAVAAGVLVVFAGTACGVRLVEEHLRTAAVIVRAGDVPVRFEPSDTGTVHFTLPEGALVRVLAERDSWHQVARTDGRRGWIEADAVEAL